MFSNCAGDDVMNESILERVNKCKRTFMLSELVDCKGFSVLVLSMIITFA